jgi:sec-independent protein translocase protein TatA
MIQATPFGFLYNIQGGQLLLIIFVALILFGGKRLPELARSIGKAVNEFRRAATDLSQEVPLNPSKDSQAPIKTVAETSESPAPKGTCSACSCEDKA